MRDRQKYAAGGRLRKRICNTCSAVFNMAVEIPVKPHPRGAGSKKCCHGHGVAQHEEPWETELADSHQLEGHPPFFLSVICTRIRARSSRLHCMNPTSATLTSGEVLVAPCSEQSPQGGEKKAGKYPGSPGGLTLSRSQPFLPRPAPLQLRRLIWFI